MRAHRCALVIVRWPDGSGLPWRGERVIRFFGAAVPHAMAVAEADGPAYAGSLEVPAARETVRQLGVEGVRALALSHEELRTTPVRLRRLTPGTDGAFLGVVRSAGPVRIHPDDVRLLVRATVWRERAAKGMAELLDIHLRDGAAYRCDALDFSFVDVLSPLAPTDAENTDRLALHLSAHAQRAEVDTGFNRAKWLAWVPRDLVGHTLGPGRLSRATDAMFNFYSAMMRCVNECRRGRRPIVPE
jgi:hypothetical protein